MLTDNASRHIVLSGCSGGGKSTLLAALAERGYATVPEPGRRIVVDELRGDGQALPWVNLAAFAQRALNIAGQDRLPVPGRSGWTFFDRGLVTAAVALQLATGQPIATTRSRHPRYDRRVFLAPPWPDIFVEDHERRHDLGEATAEYERLVIAYTALGYDTIVLPRCSVDERVFFVLDHLA